MNQKKNVIRKAEILFYVLFSIAAASLYSSAKEESQTATNIHSTKDYYEKFKSFAL